MTEQQGQEAQQDTRQSTSDAMIPKHRFDEVNGAKKEAERKLADLEAQAERRVEEAAKSQGEYQKLAEARQKKVETLEGRVKELEAQLVRGERYRAFNAASTGILLPEAVDDAFALITEDEFQSVKDGDEGAYKMLAQNLADRKPYLADGVRGAGSGGSSRPVLSLKGGQKKVEGRRPFAFKKTQRHF